MIAIVLVSYNLLIFMRKLLEFFKTTVKFDIMLRSHYLKTIPELRQCAVCFCTESANLHDINEQRALKNVFGMKLNNFLL